MEMQLINDVLLDALHKEAEVNDRKRKNFDLRTSCADTSQRMLNVLEPGTVVPIHMHADTSETVICIVGRLEEIFFDEVTDSEDKNFVEVSRVQLCPREGKYGVQIPKGVWHTINVIEPSCIFEAKDGAYLER